MRRILDVDLQRPHYGTAMLVQGPPTTSRQRLATTRMLNKVFPSRFEAASQHQSRAGVAISVNVSRYH